MFREGIRDVTEKFNILQILANEEHWRLDEHF